jgi:hypothetical protein
MPVVGYSGKHAAGSRVAVGGTLVGPCVGGMLVAVGARDGIDVGNSRNTNGR